MFSRLHTLVVVGLMAGGGVLATPVASKALEARQSFTGSCVTLASLLTIYISIHSFPVPLSSPRTDSLVLVAKFTMTRISLYPFVCLRLGCLARRLTHRCSEPGTFANGAHCGATVTITDTNTGTTATGVVADECPTCSGPGDLDLSVGLFEVFASTNAGIIPGKVYVLFSSFLTN